MTVMDRINPAYWTRGEDVAFYDNRVLRPVEVVLLVQHRDALRGRVLELGSGAGRLTGYLAEVATELHATDVSQAMLDRCLANVPAAIGHLTDLRDLRGFADASFEAIVAPYNVIDVLADADRHALFDELARLLVPAGLLVFSTHNRAAAGDLRPPWQLRSRSLRALVRELAALPRAARNHRRLRGFESDAADHAIRNDSGHAYALLHYYIDRDAQERQLAAHGFTLLECRDLDGRTVAVGDRAAHCHELHYVARAPGPDR